MDGQLVCYHHGGASPRALAAANRRLAEEAVRHELEKLGEARPMGSMGEVYDELLSVAGAAREWRLILQDRVAALAKLDQYGDHSREVAVDVALFERAMDRSAKVAELVARLNLDERRQALDERVAGQLVTCVALILDDLEITPEQRERAAQVVPARMRELTA